MTDDTASLSIWLERLPQHPPMRLLTGIQALSVSEARTRVSITEASVFHVRGCGVPASTSLEYMGQTAALIGVYAAHQQAESELGAEKEVSQDEGFLLASRSMSFTRPWFDVGDELLVYARQTGDVGAGLATFEGRVTTLDGEPLVTGSLSVWRGIPGQQGVA